MINTGDADSSNDFPSEELGNNKGEGQVVYQLNRLFKIEQKIV